MTPNTPTSPPTALWLLRAPLAIALAITAYLLYQKLDGQITSLAGCGGESGCAQILGGRWSQVFGIPVTLPAALLYIAALVATAFHQKPIARNTLAFAACTITLSAAWFVFLLVREGQFCPYCAVTHAAGLTFAITLLVHRTTILKTINPIPPATTAIFATLALATAQLVGPAPETHLVTTAEPSKPTGPVLVPPKPKPEPTTPAPAPEPAPATAPEPASGVISYSGGNITIDPATTPSIGDPAAPNILTKYFDYTCASCRDSHGDLHKAMAAYPGTFRLFLVPCPLNDACNPFTPRGVTQKHQGACELARLALSVWHNAPEKFPAYHDYLMALPLPPDIPTARAEAERLATAAKLDSPETTSFVTTRLDASVADYAILKQKGIVFPKLLLKDDAILHGVARTPQIFLRELAKRYNLPPN